MKILFYTDTPDAWRHGIWFHRINTPALALDKRGHGVKQMSLGASIPKNILEWPDVVVFGRTYPSNLDPISRLYEHKKLGQRIVYDMDDDFWEVTKDNPSVLVSNALKDQYEGLIKGADVVVTPSTVLAKKFKKHFKKQVFICPNGVDFENYLPRPANKNELIIGYMGAASHWKDLAIIGEALSELAKKHNFLFTIYGITGESMEAAMYYYQRMLSSNFAPEKNEYYKSALDFYASLKGVKMYHVPFMPPELHPAVLSKVDFDIGLAPLEDTPFNRGKSCIKFYEYAAVHTVTVASDNLPYSEEVKYRAKNTVKDWYKKIERLIVDRDFRDKVLKEQTDWVRENRSLPAIGLKWELALQRPSIKGLTVANQR